MPPGFRRLHHAPAQPQDQVAYDAPSDSEVSEGLESVVAEALMEDVDVEGAFHAVDDDDPEGEVEDPMGRSSRLVQDLWSDNARCILRDRVLEEEKKTALHCKRQSPAKRVYGGC